MRKLSKYRGDLFKLKSIRLFFWCCLIIDVILNLMWNRWQMKNWSCNPNMMCLNLNIVFFLAIVWKHMKPQTFSIQYISTFIFQTINSSISICVVSKNKTLSFSSAWNELLLENHNIQYKSKLQQMNICRIRLEWKWPFIW